MQFGPDETGKGDDSAVVLAKAAGRCLSVRLGRIEVTEVPEDHCCVEVDGCPGERVTDLCVPCSRKMVAGMFGGIHEGVLTRNLATGHIGDSVE